MAQPAPKLRLVSSRPAVSTGYAREAWYSHVAETAPDEIGPTELHVLGELLRQVHDAEGWAEASYEKLAKRTRFAVKTVRNAVKTLAEHGLIKPELVRGEGRDRLRYHFPNMHAFLTERKARRDGGRSDHGTRPKPTLVSEGENSAPLKELDSEPGARAREEVLGLQGVLKRLHNKAPRILAEAVEASAPELHDQTLAVWMPPDHEPMLRAAEGTLRSILHEDCRLGLHLARANRRPGGRP
jgi:DNA-binding Lrp family transcriptional regulator